MYDPVNDDRLEKYSVDSLEEEELAAEEAATRNEIPIRRSEPFRLLKNVNNNQVCYLPGYPKEGNQRLLEIKSKTPKGMWNCEIDEDALVRKGLQLNDDGSFSKSPREELPFIMPAARVDQMRWKKQSLPKDNLKFEDIKSKSLRNLRNLVPVQDEIFNGNDLNSSRMGNDKVSRCETPQNLTDSMKEALRQTLKKHRQSVVTNESLKKKIHSPDYDKRGGVFKKSGVPEEIKETKQSKPLRNIKNNKSDLRLKKLGEKPRLSYYERHQKKNGFDPHSISLSGCKSLGDTARSNFGDASRDALSDVSSRYSFPEEDNSEESFYQMLIEKEKNQIENIGSNRSDGPASGKTKQEVKVEKAKSTKNIALRSSAQYSFVKLSSNTDSGPTNSHHLCSIGPEILCKADLISKAKAYGNLANTRNMIKLQMKNSICKLTEENESKPHSRFFVSKLPELLPVIPNRGSLFADRCSARKEKFMEKMKSCDERNISIFPPVTGIGTNNEDRKHLREKRNVSHEISNEKKFLKMNTEREDSVKKLCFVEGFEFPEIFPKR